MLQLLVLTAALAQIPLLGYLVYRLGGRWTLAVVAGSLLALNDGLAQGSLRVKQHESREAAIAFLTAGWDKKHQTYRR